MPIIKVSNLSKKVFSGAKEIMILEKASLEVEKGEFILVTGRSGSGKSTFLYQLGLLDDPTTGKIVIKGCDTSKMSEFQKTNFRLENLGYVFQDYALLPELTARENIMLPLLMSGFTKKEALERGEDVLKDIGLSGKEDNLPSALSGGEQQRVSIGRALAKKPDIIFADEPTANLDDKTSLRVVDIFKELNKKGQTIVMVSHEPDIMPDFARVFSIVEGRLRKT